MSIVHICIISFVLCLFEISDGQWQIIMGLLTFGVGTTVASIIGKAFHAALYSFLVADATLNPIVIAFGVGFTVFLTWFLGQLLFDQFKDYSVPVLVWLGLIILCVHAFTNRKDKAFMNDCREKASDMFRFMQDRLGYSTGTSVGVSFGKFTRVVLIAMVAVSLLATAWWWSAAGGLDAPAD